MLSTIRPKKFRDDDKANDRLFKNYRQYLRYKNSLQEDEQEKFQISKCEKMRDLYIQGKIKEQDYIQKCERSICKWHQDNIDPWSGELYSDKYPIYEELDDLEDESNKLIKLKIREQNSLTELLRLKNINNQIAEKYRELEQSKLSQRQKQLQYIIQDLKADKRKNLSIIQNIDSSIKEKEQIIYKLSEDIRTIKDKNQSKIEELKREILQIEEKAENICKNIKPTPEYDNPSWDVIDKQEEKECIQWIKNGPSFGGDSHQCAPEICETFRKNPSKNPLSGNNVYVGDKEYNQLLELCDEYFKYLYKVPESIALPKRVKQFPVTKDTDFLLSSFIFSTSKIDYLIKQGIYSEGGGSSFILFVMLYLYLKHSQLLCLPYLMNDRITKEEITGKKDTTNYSLYSLTWSMKDIDKFSSVLGVLREEKVVYNPEIKMDIASNVLSILNNPKIPDKEYAVYDLLTSNHLQSIKENIQSSGNKKDTLKLSRLSLKEIDKLLIPVDDYLNIIATQLLPLVQSDTFDKSEIYKVFKTYNSVIDDKTLSKLQEIQRFPTILKNTLYYNQKMINKIKTCIKSEGKRFVYLSLSIQTSKQAHQNSILYDNKTGILERFDPLGSHPEGQWNLPGEDIPIIINEPAMDNAIYNLFTDNDLPIEQYITPVQFCPLIGPQTIEGPKKYAFEPLGYCSIWSTVYIDARLTYPDISPNILIQKMIQELNKSEMKGYSKGVIGKFIDKFIFGDTFKEYGFKSFIRDYANHLARIRDTAINVYGSIYGQDLSIKQFLQLIYASMKDEKINI